MYHTDWNVIFSNSWWIGRCDKNFPFSLMRWEWIRGSRGERLASKSDALQLWPCDHISQGKRLGETGPIWSRWLHALISDGDYISLQWKVFDGRPSFPIRCFIHFLVLPSGHPSTVVEACGLFLFFFGSEAYILFSGGTPLVSQTPSLTVMHGNNMTVLEMEHAVVDFVTLCSTPYNNGKKVEPFYVTLCSSLW